MNEWWMADRWVREARKKENFSHLISSGGVSCIAYRVLKTGNKHNDTTLVHISIDLRIGWLFVCDLINSDHHLHPILLIRFRVSLFFCYTQYLQTLFRTQHYALRFFSHLFIDIYKISTKNNDDNAFCHLNTFSTEFIQWALKFNFVDIDYWILMTFFALQIWKRDNIFGNRFRFFFWEPFLISKTLCSIFVISKLCLLLEPPL